MAKKRKSGTGTVRQRGDGRWEGRVVIGYDDSGLPKTKNILAKTKRECQEKLRQLTESMVGRNDRKVKPDISKDLPADEDTLSKYFKLHLERGIGYLSGTNFIKNLNDLLNLATEGEKI